MSFVGPRPTLPEHLVLYDTRQLKRFRVRLGVTGLAQIRGRNTMPWSERLRLDAEYFEKQSFQFDLGILLRTVGKVLTGKNVAMDRNPGQVNDLLAERKRRNACVQSNFEDALDSLNARLEMASDVPAFAAEAPAMRVDGDDLFVIGNPRSGTTLAYQICSSFLNFGYFSNLAAITWKTPEIGLVIAERFRDDEIRPLLRSDYGRTALWQDPHEAGRVWQEMLGVESLEQPEEPVDLDRAVDMLIRFRQLTGRRMVYKGVFLTWQLAEFSARYPHSRFVVMRRSLEENALSLLRWYRDRGSPAGFISLAAAGAAGFRDGSLPERAAAQAFFNEQWIRRQLDDIDVERYHVIDLEELVAEPIREIVLLADFAEAFLAEDSRRQIAHQVLASSQSPAPSEDRDRVRAVLHKLTAEFST